MTDDEKRREFEDFQYHAAGIDNGRMSRVETPTRQTEIQRQRDEETRHALGLIAQGERDTQRFVELIGRLKQRIEDVGNELDVVKAMVENMERDAPSLSDGRRVFFSRDGKAAYDENGRKLDLEMLLAAGITFDPTKPSYEDYVEAKEREAVLCERLNELEARKTDLESRGDEHVPDSELDDLEALLDEEPGAKPAAPEPGPEIEKPAPAEPPAP